MRVLVTGGCGLVGSFAVRQLLDLGHEPVLYDLAFRAELLDDVRENLRYVKGDVLNGFELLAAAQTYQVSRILHTASFLTPGADARPYAAIHTNIEGALQVYEVVRALSLERGVFCSTGKVRYDSVIYAKHVDDGEFALEADPYTHTKIAAELLLSDYRQIYGLDLVIARFCGMVYGPGYSFSGAIGQALQDLVEKPLRGEPAGLDRIAASRQTVSALLYARDAADGAVRATLADDLNGWVFNINAYSAHPLAEIAAAIGQVIPGARLDVPSSPTAGGPLEPDAQAREQLGYVPRYNLVDGFGEYVEFLQTARLRDWKVPVAS